MWMYGEVVPVDLSINLKEDQNQVAFNFIMALGWGMWTWMVRIDGVVLNDVQY
ncbi:hypothetical protein DPMN_109115 [Dreissena polymorpha]|uniref:Uncharacterized protein n=1 Tax=Dreissena polymorpha TaxID=45954 RepID=A0A9D4QLV1_DREPO|nr:hypothetical protein DPMN_109115 [Dreissena polymorpha]